jgi:hypothetical protein
MQPPNCVRAAVEKFFETVSNVNATICRSAVKSLKWMLYREIFTASAMLIHFTDIIEKRGIDALR